MQHDRTDGAGTSNMSRCSVSLVDRCCMCLEAHCCARRANGGHAVETCRLDHMCSPSCQVLICDWDCPVLTQLA